MQLPASRRGDCQLLLKVTGLHFQLTAVKVNSIAVNELLGVNRRGLRLTREVDRGTHNTLLPHPPESPFPRAVIFSARHRHRSELSHN